MAFTQTDLDAIKTAIASSELKVRLEGREVTYRSIDELIRARDVIQQELAAATTRPRATYRPTFATQRGD